MGKHTRPRSAEHKAKISAALKGRTVSGETREKLRQAKLGAASTPRGKDHPHWKGEEPGAGAAHAWLAAALQKIGRCQRCSVEGRTEWAFLYHGRPHTRCRDDYLELCRTCHRRLDWERRLKAVRVLALLEDHPEVLPSLIAIAEADERYAGLGRDLAQLTDLASLTI